MTLDLIISAAKPHELACILKIKLGGKQGKQYKGSLHQLAAKLDDRQFCYAALNKVSRSFAAVISELPGDLKDAVCVFYLVLRGLDSIEDDNSIPLAVKVNLLNSFYKLSQQTGWKIENTGDKEDYRQLLAHFDKVINLYKSLNPRYRETISLICQQMGAGMAEFAAGKVNTRADYDLYCHYVAGLVGIGLSGLFSNSGYEVPRLKDQKVASNSMGLFLQKTNIIRDYFEDIEAGRVFWPEEVWQQYATAFADFKANPESEQSLACLNALITDALMHVPDCLAYIKMLRHPQVFRFCAIPQVMAMATLIKLYNNPNVYRKNIKIRKGLAARLMVETESLEALTDFMEQFTYKMLRRLNPEDPNYLLTKKRLHRIIEAIDETRLLPVIEPETTNIEESVLF